MLLPHDRNSSFMYFLYHCYSPITGKHLIVLLCINGIINTDKAMTVVGRLLNSHPKDSEFVFSLDYIRLKLKYIYICTYVK